MSIRHARLTLRVLALITAAPLGAIQTTDVIHLKDGGALAGIIVEQEPGRSVTLATADGQTVTLPLQSIRSIEKKIPEQEQIVQHTDVVYLQDGVIFSGTIVEQIPGHSLTLELTNGKLLHLAENDVWKISMKQIFPGRADSKSTSSSRHEKWKIELQIELARERSAKTKGNVAEDQGIAEDRERLEEEIQALQEEQQDIENMLAEGESQKQQVRAELGTLQAQTAASLEKLRKQIAACNSPEIHDSAQARCSELDARLAEMFRRIESVLTEAPENSQLTEMRMDAGTAQINALVRSNQWRSSKYRNYIADGVEELRPEDRMQIYQETRQTRPTRFAVRNIIPVLSAGSWKQGDNLGATISTGVMFVGTALFVGAFPLFGLSGGGGRLDLTPDEITPAGWTGVGLIAAGYIFSLIEPYWYALRSNRRLAEALRISDQGRISRGDRRDRRRDEAGE
jgi:hypothetical protein